MSEEQTTESISIERRAKKHVKSRVHRWFAVCAPGTEAVLANELKSLGITPTEEAIHGGVEFDGKLEAGMTANLCLRTASRVLVRLKSFRARAIEDVFRETAEIPWEAWIQRGCSLDVQPTIHESRIDTPSLLETTIRAGVTRKFIQEYMNPPAAAFVRGMRRQTVMARLDNDNMELSLDSSGDLLHKRGWRIEGGVAPIRENLAATVLLAAGFKPGENLVDAMCGSGTFAIEGALIASGRAPGCARDFAMMDWPAFSGPTWEFLVKKNSGDPEYRDSMIVARDIDPRAISATKANAERAGMDKIVSAGFCEFIKSEPPCPTGLIVMNPPYGMRLDAAAQTGTFYKSIANALSANWHGWRYAVIIPDQQLLRNWPLPTTGHIRFFHGGLQAYAVFGNI